MMRKAVRLLLAVLVIGTVYLLVTRTEWVDEEVHVPRSGEAAYNRLYAVQQLIRKLGGQPVKASNLQTWPPRDATMVLSSSHWELEPRRASLLKDWVENGGHLVIPAHMVDDKSLGKWIGIEEFEGDPSDDEPRDGDLDPDEPDEADEPGRTKPPPADQCKSARCRRWARIEALRVCHAIGEPDDVSPAYANGRSYQVCGAIPQVLASARHPAWMVGDNSQTIALRVPVGRGSISVYQRHTFFDNDRLFQGDHALLAAALFQIHPGRAVWFVDEESRPALHKMLWDKAWVAVLLSLLAIGAALWRSGVRFGPLMGQLALGRRSMAEQVKGTAQFLWQRDPEALYAAQLRALDEAALPRIRGYSLMNRNDRALALHQATGLDTEALAVAMDNRRPHTANDIAHTLNLLESARRLLRKPTH